MAHTRSARYIEMKTGDASLSSAQRTVYPDIENGTAVLTNEQAKRLDVRPGMTVKETFPGGVIVEQIRVPGYKD